MPHVPFTLDQIREKMTADGYDEVIARRWDPSMLVPAHTHPFEANAIVRGARGCRIRERPPFALWECKRSMARSASSAHRRCRSGFRHREDLDTRRDNRSDRAGNRRVAAPALLRLDLAGAPPLAAGTAGERAPKSGLARLAKYKQMMTAALQKFGSLVLVVLAILVLIAAIAKVVRARRREREAARQEWRDLADWFARSGMNAPPPEEPKV